MKLALCTVPSRAYYHDHSFGIYCASDYLFVKMYGVYRTKCWPAILEINLIQYYPRTAVPEYFLFMIQFVNSQHWSTCHRCRRILARLYGLQLLDSYKGSLETIVSAMAALYDFSMSWICTLHTIKNIPTHGLRGCRLTGRMLWDRVEGEKARYIYQYHRILFPSSTTNSSWLFKWVGNLQKLPTP